MRARFLPLIVLFLIAACPPLMAQQIGFIPNAGQWHEQVKFRVDMHGAKVFLTADGLTYALYDAEALHDVHGITEPEDVVLSCHAIRLRLLNANGKARLIPGPLIGGYHSYFLGNDTSKWASGLRASNQVTYKDVYDKIDLVLGSKDGQLKYSFIVHPGGDPGLISIAIEGASYAALEEGSLVMASTLQDIAESPPLSFTLGEDAASDSTIVRSKFILKGDQLSYRVGRYARDETLVIDPTVIFSTFSGSHADNFGYTATYDNQGNAYSGGTVYNIGFPVTSGAYQMKFAGGTSVDPDAGNVARDIGILKYTPTGDSLVYATHIGGSHNEDPHSMIVNKAGNLVIFGNTGSPDFPMAGSPFQDTLAGKYDIYAAILSPNGRRLLHSTYFGGAEVDGLNGRQFRTGNSEGNTSALGFNYGDAYRGEVMHDDADNIYIGTTARSDDLPIPNSAYQPNLGGKSDFCVLKFSPDLDQLLGGSYLGDEENDAAYGIRIGSKGSVFVCGGTMNDSLVPRKGFAVDSFQDGTVDAFIARFSGDLSKLEAATYLGTDSFDQAYFLDLDQDDYVYVTGQTTDRNFPVLSTKFSSPRGKQFVAKLSPDLDSIHMSTVFGSGHPNPDVSPTAFLVDYCGRIYFSGWGGTTNYLNGRMRLLPTTSDALKDSTGMTNTSSDFYLAVFAPNMDSLIYGSFFGGDTAAEHVDGGTSRFDKNAIVYQSVCGGCGGYSDFPTTPGVVSRENNGLRPGTLSPTGCNNAIFKLDLESPSLVAAFFSAQAECLERSVQFSNQSSPGVSYKWYFGDGDSSSLISPKHLYKDTGTYTITLIATDPRSCNGADTFSNNIRVYNKAQASIELRKDTCERKVFFVSSSEYGSEFNWYFSDGRVSNVQDTALEFSKGGDYTAKLIVDGSTKCVDSASIDFKILDFKADFSYGVDSCEPRVRFINQSSNASFGYRWNFGDGTQGNGTNPNHLYPDTGRYEVQLIINPGTLCADSSKKEISVQLRDRRARFSLNVDSCELSVSTTNNSPEATVFEWRVNGAKVSESRSLDSHKLPGAGSFMIQLLSDVHVACPDSFRRTINLNPLPEAGFSTTIPPCNSEAGIVNLSNNATSYRWLFGDGQSSTEADPGSHLYRDTGSYDLSLIASPFSACADTSTETIRIDFAKFTDFEISYDSCTYAAFFKSTSFGMKNLLWQFGDGTQVKDQDSFRHAYADNRIYVAKLVTDFGGACPDSVEKLVRIQPIPKANFSTSKDTCSAEVRFNNRSTSDKLNHWLVADTLASTDESPSISFPAGYHTVLLVVNPFSVCADSLKKVVWLSSPPEARFNLEIDTCKLRLEASSESIGAASLRWALNDVDQSSNDSFSSDLEEPGSYKIELFINEELAACADTLNRIIELDSLPIADFSLVTDSCPQYFELSNSSIAHDSLLWVMNGEVLSKAPEPKPRLLDSGQYKIQLITFAHGCTDTSEKDLVVSSPVKAAFEYLIDSCIGYTIFSNGSKQANRFRWSFGDGTFSREKDPKHLYKSSTQPYLIELIAIYSERCKDTTSLELDYNLLPEQENFTINNTFTPNGDGINDVFIISGLNATCDLLEFTIYNRWGQVVFSTEAKGSVSWDGRNDLGTPHEAGTYYWTYISETLELAGTVTLVR